MCYSAYFELSLTHFVDFVGFYCAETGSDDRAVAPERSRVPSASLKLQQQIFLDVTLIYEKI